MSKMIFALTALALSVPTVAVAEEIKITTPKVNTAAGSEQPRTDVGELSRKNERDFVANPTGFSGGAMLGTGFSDRMGIGTGLKAGYTFPNRIYVGGLMNYHFGKSLEYAGSEISTRSYYLGPEAGYDVGLGKVILRPVVGLGYAFSRESVSGNAAAQVADSTNTNSRVYVAPGASVHYPIGNFFVGGDARYMVMTGDNALTLFGSGGVHL